MPESLSMNPTGIYSLFLEDFSVFAISFPTVPAPMISTLRAVSLSGTNDSRKMRIAKRVPPLNRIKRKKSIT